MTTARRPGGGDSSAQGPDGGGHPEGRDGPGGPAPADGGSGDGFGFEAHRSRLFGLAYRMLGSAEEAEDTVQDAYLRWNGADRPSVTHPGAWLAKVVTNLCLNRLTSARARREEYIGPWLPEPVLTGDGALGPLESAEQRDAVSMAVLVLLERLTPVERAVYVLREAFGYGHREIADVLDLGEANCRQLHRRAAARIKARESRFEPGPGQWEGLIESFLTAAREGDLAGLEKILARDATWWSDGGGLRGIARRPVLGRERVARFMAGSPDGSPGVLAGLRLVRAEVNGAPAVLALADGTLAAVGVLDIREGRVRDVYAVLNPVKLTHLARRWAAAGH